LEFVKKKPVGFWDLFKPKPRKPVHELKWKIPEARLTAPLEDAAPVIAVLRKHAKFVGGGEFVDVVYVKDFGENVFAYFFLRTDKKTEEEVLLFDGYMLQEEERLGVDVASAYSMMQNLEKLGYKQEFSRDFTAWKFSYVGLTVNVYDIADFGAFVEVSLPATKFVKSRELNEKTAFKLFEKIGVKKDDVIPTDVATLQLISTRSRQEQK